MEEIVAQMRDSDFKIQKTSIVSKWNCNLDSSVQVVLPLLETLQYKIENQKKL